MCLSKMHHSLLKIHHLLLVMMHFKANAFLLDCRALEGVLRGTESNG
jgi:hypothetical protein